MGLGDVPSWPVIDDCIQILNQRAIAPDVQRLHTMADSQYRLVKAEAFLEQQFVNRSAGRVRFLADRHGTFAISLRVNVVTAPRQQDSLHSRKQSRHPFLALV
jgi:hypothetical protein